MYSTTTSHEFSSPSSPPLGFATIDIPPSPPLLPARTLELATKQGQPSSPTSTSTKKKSSVSINDEPYVVKPGENEEKKIMSLTFNAPDPHITIMSASTVVHRPSFDEDSTEDHLTKPEDFEKSIRYFMLMMKLA